jgi:beta-phosphoglucomutase
MRGVLFDFDGTLANTMQNHYEAWVVALSKFGISIKESDYYPLEGMSMHSIARILCNQKTLTDSEIDKLVLYKKNSFISSPGGTLYSGVEFLIQKLNSKGIPIGIVTSSHSEQLFSKFNRSFLDRFDAIVTGDRVEHGKPHPQSYLTGAMMLGLNPGQCVAIENAPLGVLSAKSAGMYCIGVASTVSPSKLSEADEIINHIQDTESTIIFRKMYKLYE